MATPARADVCTSYESGITVDVKLDLVDAIAVGQSIRTLVRGRKLPPGTAEFYERVANQILSAAQLACKSQEP